MHPTAATGPLQLSDGELALPEQTGRAAPAPVPARSADVPVVVSVTERPHRHFQRRPDGDAGAPHHLRPPRQRPLPVLVTFEELEVWARVAAKPAFSVQLGRGKPKVGVMFALKELLSSD